MADDFDDKEFYDEEFDYYKDDSGKPEAEEKKKDGKKSKAGSVIFNLFKDIVIVMAIFLLLSGGLVIYTGSWPPVVVVESGSMMHDGERSEIGAIDTADMVLHKNVDPGDVREKISTWAEKEERHYGTYGDVIIFKKNGEEGTPILHRAVVWLEINLSAYDEPTRLGATYDVPDLGFFAVDAAMTLFKYPAFNAYGDEEDFVDLYIDIGRILNTYRSLNLTPASGFITKGDNNNAIDQPDLSLPVHADWVLGKAQGEIPWYGLVNLKVKGNPNPIPSNSVQMFFVSLVIILATPFVLDFTIRAVWSAMKKRKKEDEAQEARVLSEEVEGQALSMDEWDSMDRGGWDDYGSTEDDRPPPPPPPGFGKGYGGDRPRRRATDRYREEDTRSRDRYPEDDYQRRDGGRPERPRGRDRRKYVPDDEVADTYWEWYYSQGRKGRRRESKRPQYEDEWDDDLEDDYEEDFDDEDEDDYYDDPIENNEWDDDDDFF